MEKEIVRIHGVTPRGPSEQVNDKQIIVPAGDYNATTPFLMLSEDWFAAPRGFETHPHRGMQTVTFVLKARSNMPTTPAAMACSGKATSSG